MKVFQIILRGERSSNRGVRYRRLSIAECDQLELKAAKLLSMQEVDSNVVGDRLRQIRLNEGVRMMLVEVTKEPVPLPPTPERPPPQPDGTQFPPDEPEEPMLDDAALWEPVDLGKLLAGPFAYENLFEANDHAMLKVLYSYNHEANPIIVGQIVKKERPAPMGRPTASPGPIGNASPTTGNASPPPASTAIKTSTASSAATR